MKKLTPAQLKALKVFAAGKCHTGPGSVKVTVSLQEKGLVDGCYKITDAGRAALEVAL